MWNIPYMMENTPEEFDRVVRGIPYFEPEPIKDQLELPFDLEDQERILGLTRQSGDLKLRYGVRVIREDKGRC
jgi:hypothetical protein